MCVYMYMYIYIYIYVYSYMCIVIYASRRQEYLHPGQKVEVLVIRSPSDRLDRPGPRAPAIMCTYIYI